ncbi:MAG: hypothetical protein DSM106950_43250 [Stigonema ocellatum SAG 48.90 = DSM 106950]|nr:hypothetical protein [Stigonema ocellatum SAG 48.90 = DSM 106950]
MSHRKANNSASLLNLIPSDLFSDIEQCHSEQVLGGIGIIIITTASPKSGNDDPTGNELSAVIAPDSIKLSVLTDNTTDTSFSVYQSETNSDGVRIIVSI